MTKKDALRGLSCSITSSRNRTYEVSSSSVSIPKKLHKFHRAWRPASCYKHRHETHGSILRYWDGWLLENFTKWWSETLENLHLLRRGAFWHNIHNVSMPDLQRWLCESSYGNNPDPGSRLYHVEVPKCARGTWNLLTQSQAWMFTKTNNKREDNPTVPPPNYDIASS